MRRDCAAYIWVDVHRAMREGGLRFWQTANGVILCDGDEDGYLPPAYFSMTIHLKGGLPLARFHQKTAQLRAKIESEETSVLPDSITFQVLKETKLNVIWQNESTSFDLIRRILN